MNGRLLVQTLRWQRVRLVAVMVPAIGWGVLIPVIYSAFSDVFRDMATSGVIPEELMNFGSGSLFTLAGAMTLGVQHPLAIAMVGIFAVGASATAIAGERASGTLEVLLARPISRLTLYLSVLVAILACALLVLVGILGGMVGGSILQGVSDEIDLGRMPLVLLNGFGLWAAFTTFSLAASVSFDRPGPAIGLSLAYLLVNYFLEILGSLWTDVAWSQDYSLFHHFDPGTILDGEMPSPDLLIVFAAALLPLIYAIVIFPRRDLAAPS